MERWLSWFKALVLKTRVGVTLPRVRIPLSPLEAIRLKFTLSLISLLVSGYLLLFPALQLNRVKERSQAMALFNKASYYPVALLFQLLGQSFFQILIIHPISMGCLIPFEAILQ